MQSDWSAADYRRIRSRVLLGLWFVEEQLQEWDHRDAMRAAGMPVPVTLSDPNTSYDVLMELGCELEQILTLLDSKFAPRSLPLWLGNDADGHRSTAAKAARTAAITPDD
jgi:hypothetical protein